MQILTCLADFEQLLIIARRYGANHVKVGEVEVLLGTSPEPQKVEAVSTSDYEKQPNVSAEAYLAYKNR